jgi:hypothetical protein
VRAEEGGPAPHLAALDTDLAAHQLDQPLGDDEAGAAVAPCRRRIDLAERLEQPAHTVLGDADPGVANLEAQQRRLTLLRAGVREHRADAEHHLARIGELDRVVEQVE